MKRLFLVALLSLHQSAFASIEVFFSPKGGVRDTILEHLSQAQERIDIAMYSFSDPKIVSLTKDLARNGIKVRLILNQAQRESEKSQAFEEAGIDVRYVNMVMHHKFGIIDGPLDASHEAPQATLLSGSHNWAASAENSYDEDFLLLKNEPEKILSFQAQFNLMWNKARDFEGPASDGTQSADIEAPFASIYFTSDNFKVIPFREGWSFRSAVSLQDGVAGQALIQAMDEAQESILIATAHFRRHDFYEALLRALNRGVAVKIVLDGQEFNGVAEGPEGSREHFDETLARQGAELRYKMYSRFWNHATAKQMHSKYMIVDDVRVLTGSFNWSENAELKTFENLVVLGDSEAAQYKENFEKIFSYGREDLPALLKELRATGGHQLCHFEPVSLSPQEAKTLRNAYAPGACRR